MGNRAARRVMSTWLGRWSGRAAWRAPRSILLAGAVMRASCVRPGAVARFMGSCAGPRVANPGARTALFVASVYVVFASADRLAAWRGAESKKVVDQANNQAA